MVDSGKLSFGTVIDTSGFDEGVEAIEGKVGELGNSVEQETSKISQLLTNVPTLNIDVVTNASQSLDTIDQAYAEIDRITDLNKTAIRELEAEFTRLGQLASDAYKKGTVEGDKEFAQLQEQQKAIKAVINERKKVVKAAAEQADELLKVEDNLKKEAAALQENANKHVSLRQRIKELKAEMADYRMQFGDQTEEYKKMAVELGNLQDIQGDIQTQGSIFSNDEAKIAGVISGLNGLAGGFTAVQGAMSLFVGENEELNKVMTKLQSLMAITMGLQQVQQTLNKDSAFSLVTLNGLKEWWNSLLAVGIGEEVEDAAATVADTTATTAHATATTADTEAQIANNAATAAGTVATATNTIGQGANTAAATAGTVANIGLAGAFRMVGAAIKSIPVFGWIAAAIGVLIGVISHFVSKAEEAEKAVEEQNKILEDSQKTYAKASAEIEDYTKKIETFNGSKKREKALVDELNSKYGTALGKYDSLAQWKDVLTKKGEAYCNMLLKEAEAQAYLNKYTEAFVNLQVVKDKAAAGVYDHWYNTKAGDEASRKKAIGEAEADLNKWLDLYKEKMKEAQSIKDNFDINPHVDGKTTKKDKSSSGNTFDAKAAARTAQDAVNDYKETVKKFFKDANDDITDLIISSQKDGMVKELNQINVDTQRKKEEWNKKILELAAAQKEAYHKAYMSKKGATENGWFESDAGKKSVDDYAKELLSAQQNAKLNQDMLNQIEENGEKARQEIRQKYMDSMIEQYGTMEQKTELLTRQWMEKINTIPDNFKDAAYKQMDEEFAKLNSEQFKMQINWDDVFGNLDNQSLSSLQYTLDKVKGYFKLNSKDMGVEEIKTFQEAITKMEDAIASRNPFVSLHKSIKDISASKAEYINALSEWKTAQDEFNISQQSYNDALKEKNEVIQQIEDGKLAEDSQELTDANEKLKNATNELAKAQEKNNKAEQRTLTARNNITSAYKNFSTQLKNVGNVVKDVGGKAANLADAFGSDVSNSIKKAIDFTGEVLDATETVINAIGDVGKNVASGVEQTVQNAASGATAAAATGATAISTIEKASVILAVISAALQVATAIANLFNNDDEKQKEIEKLQERIDQLQWELDNADTVRLQNKVGKAVDNLRNIYNDTYEEVKNLHQVTERYGNFWGRAVMNLTYKNEVFEKSVEKIADAYAKVSYTADKALGSEKYENARSQLKNLAEQQILIQQQIDKESSKKKTDNSKIQDWKNQIEELAEEMATIINEMMEDIIGYTAEDLASTLGDAFWDAFKSGEDAAQAWGDKVNEIVSDILKKMIVQELLEKPIGEIFNKYKTKWFGTDGNFKGFNAVEGSLTDFANELNSLVTGFSEGMETLPDELKSIILGDASRSGTSSGIATASQESVDENNARLTTIQGHTYTLVQGMNELNQTSNAMLEKLSGIEKNTASTNDKLDTMGKNIKTLKDTVDDISSRGLKLKT